MFYYVNAVLYLIAMFVGFADGDIYGGLGWFTAALWIATVGTLARGRK